VARAGAPTFWVLGASGCTAPLIPGEQVLGDDIPAVVITGSGGSMLGATVRVLSSGDMAALAPGAGEVSVYGAGGERRWTAAVSGERIWEDDGDLLVWERGVGIWRVSQDGVALEAPLTAPTAVDRCPDGSWLTATGVGEAVDCARGELITTCAGASCDVTLDGEWLGAGSTSGAVGWWGEVPCWGDPRFAADDAPGEVRCADGTTLTGIDGEHLGVGIFEERATGIFSKRAIPQRARVVPLGGGVIWVIDRASERSRLSVSRAGDLWAVGVPGYLGTETNEGRVFLLTDPP